MNAFSKLQEREQSTWLDYIHRDLILDGGVQTACEEDGLSGVTSNPTISEKAIHFWRSFAL